MPGQKRVLAQMSGHLRFCDKERRGWPGQARPWRRV